MKEPARPVISFPSQAMSKRIHIDNDGNSGTSHHSPRTSLHSPRTSHHSPRTSQPSPTTFIGSVSGEVSGDFYNANSNNTYNANSIDTYNANSNNAISNDASDFIPSESSNASCATPNDISNIVPDGTSSAMLSDTSDTFLNNMSSAVSSSVSCAVSDGISDTDPDIVSKTVSTDVSDTGFSEVSDKVSGEFCDSVSGAVSASVSDDSGFLCSHGHVNSSLPSVDCCHGSHSFSPVNNPNIDKRFYNHFYDFNYSIHQMGPWRIPLRQTLRTIREIKEPLTEISCDIADNPFLPDLPNQSSDNNCVPGKVINLIGTKVELLKVMVTINGKSLLAIVDTGAECSLISVEAANILRLNIDSETTVLSAIGGKVFKTAGTVNLKTQMHDLTMNECKFVVVPDFQCKGSLLLGIDFLKSNNIEVCVRPRLLVKHFDTGGFAEMYVNDCGEVGPIILSNVPCYATEDVKIGRCKVERVPYTCDLPISVCKDMLYYSGKSIDSYLKGKVRGLEGVANTDCRAILMATTNHPAVIKKGQSVGIVSTVYQIDEEDETCVSLSKSITEVSLPELSLEQQAQVCEALKPFEGVFGVNDRDVGLASVTQHTIRLTNETPIYQRPRRFSPPINEEIERQCAELNSLDIIEPSNSPWSSPIVPIRKTDGSIRMCIDYRQLNKVTVPERFPIPNLSDSLYGLHGCKFFTRLDFIRGFYQLGIDENSRPYTAFSSSRQHWQFKRLSFGLINSPMTFQREIQSILQSFPSNKVIIYIDDILILGNSFKEHLSLVCKVLQTLLNYHIKIKPSKCEWFRSEVEFLGHLVGQSGIRKTFEYSKKIAEYPQPSTIGELRQFLGFVNFQRKFLPDCSLTQKPLSCLIGGRNSKKLVWSSEMIEAFDRLKSDMKVDLELAYPDYSEAAHNIELWVDASSYGAGAYLAQRQGESHRVIGFNSMSFSKTQLNYSTLERELTALRWGIKSFRPFLYGVTFDLFTDHQPIVHLHNMKIVCSRLARTVEELSDYSFNIHYVPGHLNSAADALSRINCPVTSVDELESSTSTLPDGLVINGMPAPGGGDSLFVSLLRSLSTVVTSVDPPKSEIELRMILVDELLKCAATYKIILDREARKQLRLMRCAGQMPSFDLLVAASRIYCVRIFVYFRSSNPVIYQFDNYEPVIHLQCVSGIHFNPLIAVVNYTPPNIKHCSVNTVQRPVLLSVCKAEPDIDLTSDEDDTLTEELLFINTNTKYCSHPSTSLPYVCISIGNWSMCAMFDTGAEISIVSQSTLETISMDRPVEIIDEYICEIVGLTGDKIPINKRVALKFSVGAYAMSQSHEFAIVSDDVLPFCFLLGLDFMEKYNFSIDIKGATVKQSAEAVANLCPHNLLEHLHSLILSCVTEVVQSHVIKSQMISDDVRFEVRGESATVTGLSLLIDNDTIKHIQSRSPELKSLKKQLKLNVPTKLWPNSIRNFCRHSSKLSIVNDIIVFNSPHPIIIVPFKQMLEISILVHCEFAHIGRDKMIDMLYNLLWHPSKSKIISDVATTCHECQVLKEFSTPIVKPTLKICTEYPYELLAVDLVTLPKTSNGYIGCLVVVDHYTKLVAAVPIRNKQTCTIIEALSNQIFPFLPAMPTSLLSDNGMEFASVQFNSFLEQVNVVHKYTTPLCPSSNGAIERVNRTIQGFLRSIVTEPHTWDSNLSRAIIVYNNTFHSELKMSPVKFLLTKSHKTSMDIPLQSKITQTWKVGHPKFLPFQLGQTVLMKVHRKGFLNINKLSPRFKGPYTVIKVNENGVTYQLRDDLTGDISRGHHSKLRVYKIPPKYLSEHPYFTAVNTDHLEAELSEANNGAILSFGCTSSDLSSESLIEVINSETTDLDSSEVTVAYNSSFSGSNIARVVMDSRCRDLPLGTCRGCQFESRIGAISEKVERNKLVQQIPVVEGDREDVLSFIDHKIIITEAPLAKPENIVEMYETVFVDLEDNTWQFSTVNSTFTVDEPRDLTASLDLTEESTSGLLFAVSSESNIESNSATSNVIQTETFIQTRSKGPVKTYPNVQRLILERRSNK